MDFQLCGASVPQLPCSPRIICITYDEEKSQSEKDLGMTQFTALVNKNIKIAI